MRRSLAAAASKPTTKDKENRTVNINIDMIFRLAWLAAVAALVANLAWHELGGRK